MINNELTLSSTSSTTKYESVTINSGGSTCIKESSEHVEVKSQVCKEENAILVEHGGSISERYLSKRSFIVR